jgi:hypothetical protein
MSKHPRKPFFQGVARLVASPKFVLPTLVILPLMLLWLDRALGEPVTVHFRPELITLWLLGIAAWALVTTKRAPQSILLVASGILGSSAAIIAVFGIAGTAAAIFVLAIPARSPRFEDLLTVPILLVCLSPWLLVYQLASSASSVFGMAREASGSRSMLLCLGGVLATFALLWTSRHLDAAWLERRRAVFAGDDLSAWTTALSEIRRSPLCGHRRCLGVICGNLESRFGSIPGEPGFSRYEIGIAFALEAPNVPERLDKAFIDAYGRSSKMVCARAQ